MVWFFDRGTDVLTLETRYDNEAAEYVAIVRDPTGQPRTVRFKDAVEFRTWLLEFENGLEDQQWRIRPGGPTILPDGWPSATPKNLL
jgi:hypothetical protein